MDSALPLTTFSLAIKRGARWRAVFLVLAALLRLAVLPALAAHAAVPTAEIDHNTIKLEVASTAEQIERGLMYRRSMPEDHGMVFLFHPARGVRFWMAHCFMGLDMLMIKDGKIIKIFENVPPQKDMPEQECPTYPGKDEPPLEVTEVVEVNPGYAQRHGIKEGDEVHFSFAGHPGRKNQ